jgi:hypothetical protein
MTLRPDPLPSPPAPLLAGRACGSAPGVTAPAAPSCYEIVMANRLQETTPL